MFPTPYEVTWYRFKTGARDELGNDIEDWELPEVRNVIGWGQPRVVERLGEYASREIGDVELQVPAGFSYTMRDRVGLADDPNLYEVCGGTDYTKGFHGFGPGLVVNLKRVEG